MLSDMCLVTLVMTHLGHKREKQFLLLHHWKRIITFISQTGRLLRRIMIIGNTVWTLTAILIYYNLRGLNQHCIILQFCRSGIWHKACWAKIKVGLSSSPEALRKNLLGAHWGWRQNSVPGGCRTGVPASSLVAHWGPLPFSTGCLHSSAHSPIPASSKPAMVDQVPPHFDSFLSLLPSSLLSLTSSAAPSSTFTDLCDYTGLTWEARMLSLFKVHTLIPSAKFIQSFNLS